MCMHVCLCEDIHAFMQEPLEARKSLGRPGAGVLGDCDLPDVDARNLFLSGHTLNL